MTINNNLPHIVIIGAGFGGLNAAKKLARENVRITIIDKNNYHIFQPFLYQVASAELSASDIAIPIRAQFKGNKNIITFMDKVTFIDSQKKTVHTEKNHIINYDFLIIAIGSKSNYFGNRDIEKYTTSLKSLNDAMSIRMQLIEAFEKAELAENEEEREKLLTFVIIGGGPTGVELAGAIQELINHTLKAEFHYTDPRKAKIILIEASDRLLGAFARELSNYTQNVLDKKGIIIKLGVKLSDINDEYIMLENGEKIFTNNVIWAAGVSVIHIQNMINIKLETGFNGKIKVEEDLTINSNPEIFIIGDASEVIGENGLPLPSLAAVANQQGIFAAKVISKRVKGNNKGAKFVYKDRGNLAIIGRYQAIYELKRIKLKGLIAWLIWDIIHIYFLIGTRNRLIVFLKWSWSYLTHNRSERFLIRTENNKVRS